MIEINEVFAGKLTCVSITYKLLECQAKQCVFALSAEDSMTVQEQPIVIKKNL